MASKYQGGEMEEPVEQINWETNLQRAETALIARSFEDTQILSLIEIRKILDDRA